MVRVNMEIAGCGYFQVKQTVHSERAEHMVKKSHAGGYLVTAVAVKPYPNGNVGFTGLSFYAGFALAHTSPSKSISILPSASIKRSVSCGRPAVIRMQFSSPGLLK